MKEKKILPLVLSMSMPMVLSMLVNALYNIVDSYFVAKISDEAMTALSLVYPLQLLETAVAVGFGVGINAIAAFYLGAKNDRKANDSVSVGLVLSFVHGIMLAGMIICLVFCGQLMGIFTTSAETIAAGKTAIRIISMGFVVSSVSVTVSGTLEGLGKGSMSLAISLLRYLVAIIPAAYVFGKLLGADGIWNCFWFAETAAAIVAWILWILQQGKILLQTHTFHDRNI